MKWRKLISREGVDITSISGLDVVFYDCIRQVNKSIKRPFFTLVKDRILTHYLCIDQLTVGRKIYVKYFRTPQAVKKYYQEGLAFIRSVQKSSAGYKKIKLSKNTSAQIQAFKEFRRQFNHVNYHFSIWPWWGIEAWQVDFDEIVNNLIQKRHLEDQYEIIIDSVYKAWQKTAIVKLQEELRRGVSVIQLAKRYQFLRSWSVVWYRPIDKKWITDLKQQTKVGSKVKLLSSVKLMALLRPSKKEKQFIALAPYISFFKDWRDDIRRTQVYEWSFLFDEIASSFSVPRNDLGYLSLDEIEQMLIGRTFPQKLIEYRKNHSCIVTSVDGSLKMTVLNKPIDSFLKIINSIEIGNKKTEIRGMSAQPGKVSGIVKIIKSYHDIKRFNSGEILVANTTHPNYLPAMQKAVAFITNEGGIISHAAIVARELKKPCVVGTKIATKVLKDGDMVEVDANRGIVKIIK